jgi:hypothetical protein
MDTQSFDKGKKAKTLKRVAPVTAGSAFASGEEIDMLSLIVGEAANGVDIETRYPDFYRKLMENAALRQAFLDTLALMEAEKAGDFAPLPAGGEPRLDFLRKETTQPIQKKRQAWQVVLHRTIQELKTVFSPPRLAYRADANYYEDNWFTVLRDDINLAGSNYSVLLECGISKETDNALVTTLTIAMSLEKRPAAPAFPITATLRWGKYEGRQTILYEGRVSFLDISFDAILDPQNREITSGLNLVLETNVS